jgi:hypothetical protein
VPATHLLAGSVSNWVTYALLACLSRERGRGVLPTFEEEQAMVRRLVELGAVDGMSGHRLPLVDGRGAAEHQDYFDLLANLGV